MAAGAKTWIVAAASAVINIVFYFFLPEVLIFSTEGMVINKLLFMAAIPVVEFILVFQAKKGKRASGCFGAQVLLIFADVLVIALNLFTK